MSIGGNTQAIIQVKCSQGKNAIGAGVSEWMKVLELTGWLDLSTGDSKYTNFNAKVQESTHIFLCDYKPLVGVVKVDEQETTITVTSENARMIVNNLVYEILLIDNPMEMNEHYEIYLKFVGGQNVN